MATRTEYLEARRAFKFANCSWSKATVRQERFAPEGLREYVYLTIREEMPAAAVPARIVEWAHLAIVVEGYLTMHTGRAADGGAVLLIGVACDLEHLEAEDLPDDWGACEVCRRVGERRRAANGQWTCPTDYAGIAVLDEAIRGMEAVRDDVQR